LLIAVVAVMLQLRGTTSFLNRTVINNRTANTVTAESIPKPGGFSPAKVIVPVTVV
jgi:hypothetical protein